VVARVDGDTIATGLAFNLGDDCGIYNVSTVRARRAPHRPAHGLSVTPVFFDVLAADGKDLRSRPWLKRHPPARLSRRRDPRTRR
jgi:ATP-dependent DNA ligase